MRSEIGMGVALMLSCIVSEAEIRTFSDLSTTEQRYIVTMLSRCPTNSIPFIIQSKNDEFARADKPMDNSIALSLGLKCLRAVALTSSSANEWKPTYFYPPAADIDQSCVFIRHTRTGERYYLTDNGFEKELTGDELWQIFPPYAPQIDAKHEYTCLVFAAPTRQIRKTLIFRDRRPDKMEPSCVSALANDAERMGSQKFLKQHHLEQVFESDVYSILPGCIFQYNFPVPEYKWVLPPSPIGPSEDIYRENILKARKRESNLIQLSQNEISDVLLFFFRQRGNEGIEEYKTIARKHPNVISGFIDVRSELGKMLFDTLSGENAEETIQKPSFLK